MTLDNGSTQVSAAAAIAAAPADAWLLDVRERDEWAQGHAPTAHLIPMSELEGRVAEVPLEDVIHVICHSGSRSDSVARWLRAGGRDAVNVEGGMMAWMSAGGVVVVDGADSASA